MSDSKKELTGSIALTKLVHIKMEKNGKNGKPVQGIFIPIEPNKLTSDAKGNVYIPVRVIYNPEKDKYEQNGFIAKTLDSKDYKALTDDQKKDSEFMNKLNPILGNIKSWEMQTNDNSGQASEQTYDADSDDDLPF